MPQISPKESVDLRPYKSGLDAIMSGIREEIEVWYARSRDTEDDDDLESEHWSEADLPSDLPYTGSLMPWVRFGTITGRWTRTWLN